MRAEHDTIAGEAEVTGQQHATQPASVGTAADSAAQLGANGAPVCYRVGPLRSLAQADEAAARLRQAGASAVSETGFTEEIIGYWVLERPLPSIEAATARMRELRQRGIDTFVITEPPLTNAISLGVFKQESAAKRGQIQFASVGIQAEVEPRIRRREAWWLHAEWPPASPGQDAPAAAGAEALEDLAPSMESAPCR
jgi:hypothetical protein